jgi:hypothetical protein
VIVSCSDCTRP